MAAAIVRPAQASSQFDALVSAGAAPFLAQYRPSFPPAFAVGSATATLRLAIEGDPNESGPSTAGAQLLESTPATAGPPFRFDGWQLVDRTTGTRHRFGPVLCRTADAEHPEGPAYYASVGPGRIRIASHDPARIARRKEGQVHRRRVRVDLASAHSRNEALCDTIEAAAEVLDAAMVDGPQPTRYADPLARPPSRSRIVEWSRKSRSMMVDRLSTLDYEPLLAQDGVPAMVTATMPDSWHEIAPTGRRFKGLVRNFVKRYERAWCHRRTRACDEGCNGRHRMIGLWKLEFQRRGAPHLHMLMVPPTGHVDGRSWPQWYANAWADVLGVSGETRARVVAVHSHPTAAADYAEGLRASDPKRVAVYFLKHNLLADKEYQHIVPPEWQGPGDGPGRFWGYWGLDRADMAVPVSYAQAVAMARTLRRWQRSKGGTRNVSVVRTTMRRSLCECRDWYVCDACENPEDGRERDADLGVKVVHRRRTVRRRLRPMPRTFGYLVLNDAPAAALMLSTVTSWLRTPPTPPSPHRLRRLQLATDRS